MNWIKRAFRSISYHKKNTILMFLSFLILSILILFGLCIRAASRERIWEIRTSIGGSVLVSNERQIYSEEPRGVNSISHQKYLELCADERIRFGSCNTVTAALADNFTAEIMDGQEENGTENIYVEGSSDPVEYFSSVSSVVTLISGHVPQNAEEAVVSDGIAERNGLGIGDTIFHHTQRSGIHLKSVVFTVRTRQLTVEMWYIITQQMLSIPWIHQFMR